MRILLVLLMSVAAACGADLTGTWIVERPMPGGGVSESTLKLRQDGSTLTGTMGMMMGEMPIRNGHVEGDTFTFDIVLDMGGEERRITQTGKIVGPDQLEITMGGMRGPGGPAGPGAGPAGPGGGPPRRMSPQIARRLTPELERERAAREAARPKPRLPETRELPDNGLARTPPMGWNSWNHFRTRIDDKTIREIADAMVASGMKQAGYLYVNIDDGWQGKRDAAGVLQPNERFPDMKALADYVHVKGLKLGIYSSPGPRTCAGYEGSFGHEEQDAKTWAAWGIDYLKYDWCSAAQVYQPAEMRAAYQLMGEALRATGRPIVYGLCQYGRENVQQWGPAAGGNLWRTTGDIRDTWASMSNIGFRQNGLEKFAGPGHWNDPDMLEVGNGGMSDVEYRTHMSLWAMLAAPLLAGNDVRSMTPATREILTQPEVIAINQDKLGRQGYRAMQNGETEVWVKPLAGGAWAIALYNRSEKPIEVTARWTDLQLSARQKVRDVWARKDVGVTGDAYSAEVPAHGTVLLRVSK